MPRYNPKTIVRDHLLASHPVELIPFYRAPISDSQEFPGSFSAVPGGWIAARTQNAPVDSVESLRAYRRARPSERLVKGKAATAAAARRYNGERLDDLALDDPPRLLRDY